MQWVKGEITMKRSKTITLTLLTGTALIVTGCQEDEAKSSFFKDSAACVQELKDSAACDDAQKDALAQHLQSAPKFTSKEECEQKFGAENCVQPPNQQQQTNSGANVSHGGGFFMPMMMGYMMGKMGGGGMFGGGSRWGSQPIYRDNSGNAFAGGNRGGLAGLFKGNNFEPSKTYAGNWSKNSSPSTVRRGGFGTSSHFAGS
jgi:uncharacterized protein YgiB involved in biofilm formation